MRDYTMKNNSPSGKATDGGGSGGSGTSGYQGRHDAAVRQSKVSAPKTLWWNEPKPKGGRVDANPTRSDVGTQAPTIGPRVA